MNDFCGSIGEIKAGKPDEALVPGTEIRYGQFMEDVSGVGAWEGGNLLIGKFKFGSGFKIVNVSVNLHSVIWGKNEKMFRGEYLN